MSHQPSNNKLIRLINYIKFCFKEEIPLDDNLQEKKNPTDCGYKLSKNS